MKKEVRALLPIWIAAAAGLATVCLVFPDWPVAARLLYAISSISLAAMSIGHEYLSETLPSYLSLPVTRTRLLVMKLSALVPMLLILTLVAFLLLPPDPRFDTNTVAPRLSLLCAVLTAPLFTMLGRSPLAGGVFSVGVIGGLQLLAADVVPSGLLVASAIGVVGGWRAFMRLEAIDGRSVDLVLPLWFSGSSNTTWLLIQKELRLQQMAFVIAGLNLVSWTASAILWSGNREVRGLVGVLSFIYGAMMAILIGSLAGAEERHMRTLEWQLLLPIAAWKQWMVKTAVVLGLAQLLCFALPVVLTGFKTDLFLWPAAGVVVLTVGSLYISTLCPSSLVAVAVSAPVMLISTLGLLRWVGPYLFVGDLFAYQLTLGVTAFGALALRLAYDNHRFAGH